MRITKEAYPRLALTLGLVIALVLLATGGADLSSAPAIPLLTVLILCEFGFILTAIGAFTAVRRLIAGGFAARALSEALGCIVLAVAFAALGLARWPGGGIG
jgi:hypothetical protein